MPIRVTGFGESAQTEITIDKPSAQIVSACILAGMNSHGLTTIEAPNAQRDHTELMLKHLKYPITVKNLKSKKIIKIMGKQLLNAEKNMLFLAILLQPLF